MCGVIPQDKYEVSSYTWIHIDLDLQSYIKTIPVTSTYSEQHFCDKIMWCGDRERKTSEEQKVHAAKFLEHNKAAYTKDDQPKIQSLKAMKCHALLGCIYSGISVQFYGNGKPPYLYIYTTAHS